MSFFGVELNAQVNKLNLQIKLNLSRNKTMPNFRTLYKGFYANDKNLNGTVTPDQFEEVLGKNGIFLKKFEYQAYQKAYADESGRVNWFTFLGNIREPLQPKRKQLVEKIFDNLDTEHKGAINYKTLMNSFNPKEIQQFKEGKKTKEVLERQLLSMVNLTADGNITREEFINFYEDLNMNIPGDMGFRIFISSMWSYPLEEEEKTETEQLISSIKKIRFKLIQKTQGTHDEFLLKKVFDEFDQSQQGSLNPEDLFLMLIKLEIPIERRLLDPVFNKFDRNSSGLIEYNEFKNFLFFDPYPI